MATQSHVWKRPFFCNICYYLNVFDKKSDYERHMRFHAKGKNVAWIVCTAKDHSKIHKLLYTGEKPYHCDVCRKQFPEGGRLQIHLRLHYEEEKPHTCDVCQKQSEYLVVSVPYSTEGVDELFQNMDSDFSMCDVLQRNINSSTNSGNSQENK